MLRSSHRFDLVFFSKELRFGCFNDVTFVSCVAFCTRSIRSYSGIAIFSNTWYSLSTSSSLPVTRFPVSGVNMVLYSTDLKCFLGLPATMCSYVLGYSCPLCFLWMCKFVHRVWASTDFMCILGLPWTSDYGFKCAWTSPVPVFAWTVCDCTSGSLGHRSSLSLQCFLLGLWQWFLLGLWLHWCPGSPRSDRVPPGCGTMVLLLQTSSRFV